MSNSQCIRGGRFKRFKVERGCLGGIGLEELVFGGNGLEEMVFDSPFDDE